MLVIKRLFLIVFSSISFFLQTIIAQQLPPSNRINILIHVGDQITTTDSRSYGLTPARPAASYYVDSVHGNDYNSGTSLSNSWRHLSKVNDHSFNPGEQIILVNGSVWHEQLTVPSSGTQTAPIVIRRYSSTTAMPIIDGADIITGWTPQTATVFRAPYTQAVRKGFVDSQYNETSPLILERSPDEVVSTPGSLCSDGHFVYIHLSDNSNPQLHQIEVSGARKYGIDMNSRSHVIIDGIKVIRAAKSGIIAASLTSTGSYGTIQNCVLFNNGDTLGDPSLGGQVGGSIAILPAYLQSPLPGWIIRNNVIGRSDFAGSILNWAKAAIEVAGSISAQITGNKVSPVRGTAIQVTDWFGTGCAKALIANNETSNGEGNISEGGCPNTAFIANVMRNSFGNGLELGAGLQLGTNGDHPYLLFNQVGNLGPAYLDGMYNGIDVNHASYGVAAAFYITLSRVGFRQPYIEAIPSGEATDAISVYSNIATPNSARSTLRAR